MDENPAVVVPDSPEDILERTQMSTALVSAISRLNEEEQQVMILRYVEGLPHDEVADIIGKSNEASRVIQHRALSKLTNWLKQ
jgi:RNA polymerase sigma-70 factor (ECF subfamily)